MTPRNNCTNKKAPSPRWLTIGLPIAALIISLASFGNSYYQTVQSRKIFRSYVRPDILCLVRHSSRAKDEGNPPAAEMVIWNSGPIKAVSVSMAYRDYLIDPATLKVPVSIGIADDLLDVNVLRPELAVGDKIIEPILGAGPMGVFAVNITYYRESDMEKFSHQEFFFYDSGSYYDQHTFMGRTNYSVIMRNIQRKMRAEALQPLVSAREMAPTPDGLVRVNMNFANLTDDGVWTNGAGTKVTLTPIGPLPSK